MKWLLTAVVSLFTLGVCSPARAEDSPVLHVEFTSSRPSAVSLSISWNDGTSPIDRFLYGGSHNPAARPNVTEQFDIPMVPIQGQYYVSVFSGERSAQTTNRLRVERNGVLLFDVTATIDAWDFIAVLISDLGSPRPEAGGVHRRACGWRNGELYCMDAPVERFWTGSSSTIKFDFDKASRPAGVRLLVAKHFSGDYPEPTAQLEPDADNQPRMRISGSVKGSGGEALTTPTKIYLRLRDPGDTAEYMTTKGQSFAGDNHDPSATLSANGASVRPFESCESVCPPLEVTTDATGKFEAILTGTKFSAGDNYQIEASNKADFSCDSGAVCARSVVITAWKQIAVMPIRMYKAGGQFREPASPNDPAITIQGRCNGRFKGGDKIYLLHKARLDGTGLATTPPEEQTIKNASNFQQDRCLLQLEGLVRGTYYNTDTAFPRDPLALADSVVVINEGLFEGISSDAVRDVWNEAFVDVRAVSGSTLPHKMFREDGADLPLFLTKWIDDSSNRENLFFLISADLFYADGSPTGGNHHDFANAALVFKGITETLAFPNSDDESNFVQEIAVHELGHGWAANKGYHCKEARWDRNEGCALVENPYVKWGTSYAATTPDVPLRDGNSAFHLRVDDDGAHSEYLDIRHRTEPVPVTREKTQ